MMYKPLVNREESIRLGALEEGLEEGREEGRKEGREEGREEGRKEGREEGRKEASETMYRVAVKRGVSSDVLADLARTGGISKERATRIYNEVVGEPDGYVTR